MDEVRLYMALLEYGGARFRRRALSDVTADLEILLRERPKDAYN